ncbi:hypothetical protein [Streptomyces sp. NPDC006333]|uniref:hypothetical protein n=1 Tax=Streptomyces sp. NPDC006333 TaxID=3156753 RepID=UPI0033A10C1E
MREGPNPYGPRGSLSLDQIEEIQVYRANHEPGYLDHYYRKDGTRRFLGRYDESGYTPPQLTRPSEDMPWTPAKDRELHATIDTATQWSEARGAYKESHTDGRKS